MTTPETTVTTTTDRPKRSGSGPSGRHRSPQRLLSQQAEAWEQQDAAAALMGVSWAVWARAALERQAAAQTGPSAQARRSREARYERRRVALEESRRQMVDRDEQ